MLNNLISERIMDLRFPIRHLQDRLNEFRLDLHRLRLYRSESWNYDVEHRIEEYEQAIEILTKANGVEQSESTCNLQNVSCRVVEMHEQGHPEVIELKHKGKWMRYQHFSKEHEKQMNDYIKKTLSKLGS